MLSCLLVIRSQSVWNANSVLPAERWKAEMLMLYMFVPLCRSLLQVKVIRAGPCLYGTP